MALTKLQPFNIDPTASYAFANVTATNANLGNAATANFFIGDGSLLTGLPTASGSNFANYAGNVTVSSQPNITSVGELSSVVVSGTANLASINLSGNIIPTISNTFSLGSETLNFKDVYIGPGSLYINGSKVLEEVSNAIIFTADLNQTVRLTTSGTGDIQLLPTGTGIVSVQGPLQILAGAYITSSNGSKIGFSNPIGVDSITTLSANTDLVITGNGSGNVKVDDDLIVTGNLTLQGTTGNLSVTNLSVQDNIIDISAETTGIPSSNAGIRVIRGDEPATLLRWTESLDSWQFTNDGSTYLSLIGKDSVGNISLGNVAISNYFVGNGSQLTGLIASSVAGANVTGTVANATYADTAGTAYSVAGANVSGTVANASYAVSAAYAATSANAAYADDAANATYSFTAGVAYSVSGANVSGTVANASYSVTAATAYSVSAANVTGLGNIATVNLTGSTSNVLYGNGVFAPSTGGGGGGSSISNGTSNVNIATSGGNVTVAAAGNTTLTITSTGVNVAGTLNANNANITSNITIGAGSGGYLTGANIIFANYFVGSGGNLSNIQAANVTGLGNIATVTLTGSTSNVLYGNGVFAPASGGGSSISNGTSNVDIATLGGNVTVAVAGNTSLTITDTGINVAGTLTVAGNATITGNLIITGTTVTVDSNNIAYTDSIIEIHTQSNLAPLTVDDGKDIGMRAHYFKGTDKHAFFGWSNDSGDFEYYADGIETAGVFSGTYGMFRGAGLNSTVTTGTAPFIVNSTTQVANLNVETAGTAYSVAVANVTGIGNISTINIDGSSSNVLYGNGVFAAAPTGGGGGGGSGTAIVNGTSNVDIATSGGNVTVGVGGVANTVIFSSTSMNVATNANITGNLVIQGVSVLVGSGTGGNISGANAITSNSYTITGSVTGNADVNTITGPLGIRAIASTYTDNQAVSGSGNIANAAIHAFAQPTLASANGITYTNAATFYIANAPIAGINTTITNAYGLMVNGNARFFGNIIGTVANGNSNVDIATADGNVTIAAVGNTTLTVTGTGVEIVGTANISSDAIINGSLRVGNGFGYLSSAAGAAAQVTSRTSTVTLNTVSGSITLFSSTTTAGTISLFTVLNTFVTASDVIILSQQSGISGAYIFSVSRVGAGSFQIQIFNAVDVAAAESPIINFAVVELG